jgi:hypothetical protein
MSAVPLCSDIRARESVLDAPRFTRPSLPPARRPDGRCCRKAAEESPGSTGIRCRLTAGGGDPRESATENKPPAQAPQGSPRARAKRCGKSAPRHWQQRRQGKPHREQDRIGTAAPKGAGAFPLRRPGWSREARRKARPRGMVVPRSPDHSGDCGQNPAYRPSGSSDAVLGQNFTCPSSQMPQQNR